MLLAIGVLLVLLTMGWYLEKFLIKKNWSNQLGPFRILCQLGKIKNTKGHKYENRNRCRAIC